MSDLDHFQLLKDHEENLAEARDMVLAQADLCSCGSGDDRDLWNQALGKYMALIREDTLIKICVAAGGDLEDNEWWTPEGVASIIDSISSLARIEAAKNAAHVAANNALKRKGGSE